MKTEIQTYTTLLRHIKQRVAQAQQRAIYSANEEMLRMYWDVGEMLTGSQMADGWGQKTLERLSVDLKNEFPKIKGFSVRNMQFMMQFYEEYNKELTLPKCHTPEIAKLPISQLNKNTVCTPCLAPCDAPCLLPCDVSVRMQERLNIFSGYSDSS